MIYKIIRCFNCSKLLDEQSLPTFCNKKCLDEWATDYADSILKPDRKD